MGRYVIRRLLQALLTLGIVLFLLHYLMALSVQVRGNPALLFFGGERTPDPAMLAQVERLYNLDNPCYERTGDPCVRPFIERLQNYAAGDFGTTLNGNRDVGELLGVYIPNTLRLFVFSTITLVVLAMVLGTWAARHHGRVIDHSVRGTTILIDSVPVFLILLAYVYIVAVPLTRWARGIWDTESFMGQVFRPNYNPDYPWTTIIVPGIILGSVGLATLTRLVRASQLENLGSDFVKTAKAKGLKQMRITVVHVVRNSMIPIVTGVGYLFAFMLSGAVLTEGVMGIPGMGRMIFGAVQRQETNLVIVGLTISAIVVVVVSLLVDLIYAALDPRIRYE
ncbi:ABC transporter permease [Glycomyces buryatensis]|uniref:ABC transporter permease n=1 Tax=Glycomyces buryatensis TaxID=2570927 RepID=A0A4S8QDH1_9ACTN|nr:ABC transporter permease [Glycomyces buryatensis]THV42593.1 ABC transporter permease [Glycomyces buryatensis]